METLGAGRRGTVRDETLDVKPYNRACSPLSPYIASQNSGNHCGQFGDPSLTIVLTCLGRIIIHLGQAQVPQTEGL